MTRKLFERSGLALVALTLCLASFLATSVAIHTVKADDPGKPRGRNVPEAIATLTPQERAQAFQPGRPWDGVGRGGSNPVVPSSFQDYPLFWLGENFADFNLQAVRRVKYSAPAGAKSQDRVAFIYGECMPVGGDRACPAPAQVHVHPICFVLPDQVAEEAKLGNLQTLSGGAKLQRFGDGHIMVWTGTVAVEISVAANPSLVNKALSELRGVGRNSHKAGQALEAPDFGGC
jgi:hypothetical protein